MKPAILIDFENVNTADFTRYPDNASVFLFTGEHQKKIDLDIVEKSQSLGNRLRWIRIKGTGKNAADFHIAYFIGTLTAADPTVDIYIVSKDKGFDPLVKYLSQNGFHCKRIDSDRQLGSTGTSVTRPSVTRPTVTKSTVRSRLERLSAIRRPKTRKALVGFIKSLSRNTTDADAEREIADLVASNYCRENGNRIEYQPSPA